MSAGARAMGLTQAKFIKMVESGKVLSNEFMPKFATEIRKMVRENGALEAAQGKIIAQQSRMITSFKILADKVFQGKFGKAVGKTFGFIAKVTKALTPIFADTFGTLGAALEATIGALDVLGTLLSPLGYAFGKVWDAFLNGVDMAIIGVWSLIKALVWVRDLFQDSAMTKWISNFRDANMAVAESNPEFAKMLTEASKWNFFLSDPSSSGKSGGSSGSGATTINVQEMSVHANDPEDFATQIAP